MYSLLLVVSPGLLLPTNFTTDTRNDSSTNADDDDTVHTLLHTSIHSLLFASQTHGLFFQLSRPEKKKHVPFLFGGEILCHMHLCMEVWREDGTEKEIVSLIHSTSTFSTKGLNLTVRLHNKFLHTLAHTHTPEKEKL